MAPTSVFYSVFWGAAALVRAVNAVALPTNSIKCAFEDQTEYLGKSYQKIVVDTPGQCCAACQEDDDCNVWTYRMHWAKSQPKACWLMKDANTVDQVNSGEKVAMISGIRQKARIPLKNITFEEYTDYSEKNLYTLNTMTPQECADFCAAHLLCKAFSFYTKKRSCYAKPGTWGKKHKDDFVSAVVW